MRHFYGIFVLMNLQFMCRLFFILILLSIGIKVNAKCAGSGISFWPSSSFISENPVFVITFYSGSRDVVKGLNNKYKMYLKANSKNVRLSIVEIHQGEFNEIQVLVKPEFTLTKGLEYKLFIDNLPAYASDLRKWNKQTKKLEQVKWLVNEASDISLPLWNSLPKFDSSNIIYYGCGPEKWVYFSYSSVDNSNLLIKTTVKSNTTGLSTTYYIEPEKNIIQVGHGMCTGPFYFENGNTFIASFTMMDASGNLSHVTSKAIQFTKPLEKL